MRVAKLSTKENMLQPVLERHVYIIEHKCLPCPKANSLQFTFVVLVSNEDTTCQQNQSEMVTATAKSPGWKVLKFNDLLLLSRQGLLSTLPAAHLLSWFVGRCLPGFEGELPAARLRPRTEAHTSGTNI